MFQVHALAVYGDAFGFEPSPLLVLAAAAEGDAAVRAQHAMPGQAAACPDLAEDAAYQPRPSRQAGKGGDIAVGTHTTRGNRGYHQMDPLPGPGFRFIRGWRCPCYTVGSGHPESTLRYLFLLFVMMPVMELYILIRVGQWLGAWPTVGLVFLTAAVGISLLRQQGFSTLRIVRARLEAGELPAREMVEGLVLVVGGAMFLAPGFVTDIFGFTCLLPPTRRRIATFLMARGVWHVQASVRYGAGPGARSEEFRAESQGRIIEGEFERNDDPRP